MFKRLKEKIEIWLYNDREKNVTKVKIGEIKFTKNNRNIHWDEGQLKLKSDIKNGKFDSTLGLPTISSDKICLDGHHRITALLETYGPDYKINVYKLTHKYRKIFLVIIFYYFLFEIKK
jgi:hypothetical protein